MLPVTETLSTRLLRKVRERLSTRDNLKRRPLEPFHFAKQPEMSNEMLVTTPVVPVIKSFALCPNSFRCSFIVPPMRIVLARL
jgi:hypothetical protein